MACLPWLQQVGLTETRIIQKAGDFGGTWYWNRYPGAQCDIESYIYQKMNEIAVVKNCATAEALKPWYGQCASVQPSTTSTCQLLTGRM